MDTVYIGIIFILEIYRVITHKNIKHVKIDNHAFYLIIYFLLILLNSLLVTFFIHKSTGGIVLFLKLFQYVIIFLFILKIPIDYSKFILVLKTFIWTGISTAILAIVQKFSGQYSHLKGMPSFTEPIFREINFDKIAGEYSGSANYNSFAAFLVIPIIIIFLSYSLRKLKILNTKFILISIFILSIGLFLANSRIAILSILFSVFFIGTKKSATYILKSTFIFITFFIIFFYFYSDTAFIKNFTDIFVHFSKALPYLMAEQEWFSEMGISGDVYGAISRVVSYYKVVLVFLNNPFFGCGFGMIVSFANRHPENYFLQILAELGVTIFLMFLVFIIKFYKQLSYNFNDSFFNEKLIKTMTIMFWAMIIMNMTGSIFTIQKVWGPFLLIFGFYFSYQKSFYTYGHPSLPK